MKLFFTISVVLIFLGGVGGHELLSGTVANIITWPNSTTAAMH